MIVGIVVATMGEVSKAVLIVTSMLCLLAIDTKQDVLTKAFETAQDIRDNGYESETHHVVTIDGYILEMHRIPFKKNETEGAGDRPVVFIMHGLTAASYTFIELGPQYSIAYNFADAGFDVWMGNARGTKNSRSHVTMDPDASEHRSQFFDFTWEEIGMLDLPAMIDYVLQWTGQDRLHYLGHSQGGTAFLVLNSMRPEYNEKFATVNLLAGVGYMANFPNGILKSVSEYTYPLYSLATSLGVVEMFPPLSRYNITSGYKTADYCAGDLKLKDFCELIGIHELLSDSPNIWDIIENYQTGGAAFKQIAHYGQNVKAQLFRRWNYGTEQNLIEYGTTDPPEYDLSLITAPVTMHYTVSDFLLDERDVYAMAKVMPNTVVRRVAKKSFTHTGFVYDTDAKELVTDYIIDLIQNYDPQGVKGSTDASSTLLLSATFKIYLNTYILYQLFY